MKVLYIMNHVDHGGAALALYDLIHEFSVTRSDIECVVITSKHNKLNEALDNLGIVNYSFNFNNFMSSYHEPQKLVKFLLSQRYKRNNLIALRNIEKQIDISSFDIIHTNLNRIDIGAMLSKKYHIPHVWHIREHGETDFKLISIFDDPITYMNSFKSTFIFISKSVEKAWISRGLDNKRTELIYDGVRTELYPGFENVPNHQNEKMKFIFLGGYCDSKGQKEAIKAISKLRDKDKEKIIVDMYGSGSKHYIKSLQQLVSKYDLDSIVNINNYDPKISKKLPLYDIGLTCSADEGFGRVTVEYMLSGLCPLVSDTGANPELVTNKVDGLIYPKGEILELRNLIQYCLHNQSTINKLKKSAYKKARDKFSMKRHAWEIANLYQRLLGNKGNNI